MRFNEGAELDTSQVGDRRGGGGRLAVGGGGLGILGLIVYFVISQLGGGDALPPGSGFGDVAPDQQVGSEAIGERCRTGADANREADCRAVAFVNSVQAYWSDVFASSGSTYREAETDFFTEAVRTGCGDASSATGPFYCPADAQVYIDLTFFQELHRRFGATGGPFVEGYVLRTSTATTCRTWWVRRTGSGRAPARGRTRCAWSCRRTATRVPGPTMPRAPRPRPASR